MSILYWVLCTFYRVLCVLLLCIVCIVCIVIVCIVCIVIVYFYRGLCVLLLCIVIVEWSVYHCYCVEIEAFGGIEPQFTFSSHSVSKYKEIKMLRFWLFSNPACNCVTLDVILQDLLFTQIKFLFESNDAADVAQ